MMRLLDQEDPLSDLALDEYNNFFNVNHNSVIVAMKEAVAVFKTLDSSASKSFLFTGNALNTMRGPAWISFGVGKNATAYAVQTLAESKVYEKDNISFYYVDERQPSGYPMMKGTDAEAAAEEYPKIAEIKGQGEWLYTFVKSEGYRDFSKDDIKF